jgi:hypothetical protein
MNGRVRNMNLWLEPCSGVIISHINVTGASYIVTEYYTMNGVQLNSLGTKRFTQLTAERVVGGHPSGISNTHVITHARSAPILA